MSSYITNTYSDQHYDLLFKVILIGDAGVGKTSLLSKYIDNTFKNDHVSTIGVDFKTILLNHKNRRVKLQLWDTAGQERFRSIIRIYYKNSNVAMILFDLTNKSSFLNVHYWIKEINEHSGENTYILLVGTKSDLINNRVVTIDQIYDVTKLYSIDYIETSSKTDTNIQEIFVDICKKIMHNLPESVNCNHNDNKTTPILLNNNNEQTKRNCFCC